MKKLLLAVGNEDLSNLLKPHFEKDFMICGKEVFHLRFLEEILEEERPDLLVLHETFLESDAPAEHREEEWLLTIERIRYLYDTDVRVVFFCERANGDPFLNALVAQYVLDIFNEQVISFAKMIEQIKSKPKYSNVAMFVNGTEAPILPRVEQQNNITEPYKEVAKKSERPIIQKVVEKKVINKIVEKNVIKKEFQLNFQREVKVKETIGIPIEPKTVLIGGAYQRIGSSFISHLLTDYVAGFRIPVTYIENPYRFPYTFDRYFGEEHYSQQTSAFHSEAMKEQEKMTFVNEMEWYDGDKQLVVLNPLIERPYTLEQLDFESILKIILKHKSPITIIDVGNDWNNPVVSDLLDIASDVFLVVDSDPFATQNFFEQRIFSSLFKENRLIDKVTVIMNKSSEDILDDDIFEGIYDDILSFPYIAEDKIFSHISDRRWLYPLIAKDVEKQLNELALYFLPEELLQKQQKKSTGFFSLPKFSIKSK